MRDVTSWGKIDTQTMKQLKRSKSGQLEAAPERAAIYFFIEPLLILSKLTYKTAVAWAKVPSATLRVRVCLYRQRAGGITAAEDRAKLTVEEYGDTFKALFTEWSKLSNSSEFEQLCFRLYWGFDAAFVKYHSYQPGQWVEQVKREKGFDPRLSDPYRGVVRNTKRKEDSREVIGHGPLY